MILSNQCWLKDKCVKYLDLTRECECRTSDVFCTKLFKLDYLYSNSLLTTAQRKTITLELAPNDPDMEAFIQLAGIEKSIDQFVKEGRHLYIHSSNPGTGKTAWSIKLLQAYLNKIWFKCDLECKILFVHVPKYLLSVKDNIGKFNSYAQFITDNVLKADLVVWDELGTKSITSYEHEQLLSIINSRIDDEKSNIYTSNMANEQLKELIGDKLYSRVVNLSTVIEFVGEDKRGMYI